MHRTISFLKFTTLAILLTACTAIFERAELFAAQLTLSWTDNASNEEGIRVERKQGSGGTYAPLASLPSNAIGYVDAGLANATEYCYRVGAFNSIGTSYSNEACGTTAAVTYSLSISKTGTGSGTVTADGINCGSNCSEVVTSGTEVALTATPAAGSIFAGWSGTGCVSTVTVTGNMTCTATFNLVTYSLTVVKAGAGSGTVTATGINCGSDCSQAVNSGTQVALTATPAAGSTFAGWSGTGCASTVTVTGNMMCTATFNLSSYTLTVVKAGTGSGTVTATGINCGSDCSQVVNSGTQVALTATPAVGSSFVGWSGTGCASTVTVTGNMTCTAKFNDSALIDRVGLYRPSTGEWFFDLNGNSVWDGCQVDFCVQSFGNPNAVPVVGTWDASGVSQVALFFPTTQEWYLDNNTNETWEGCAVDTCVGSFGLEGDVPVAGKWTSDGYDRLGVFRPSTGYWYLDENGDGSLGSCRRDGCEYLSVYANGDLPVVGDWSGKGTRGLGLFRPSTGQWFLDKNGNKSWNGCGKDRCVNLYGAPGDLPVVGDWNGAGRSAIGVFRPSTGEWFLDYNDNSTWDGCGVDACVTGFGTSGDMPVVGKW
jgi:Divergent InlB B-repeat domain